MCRLHVRHIVVSLHNSWTICDIYAIRHRVRTFANIYMEERPPFDYVCDLRRHSEFCISLLKWVRGTKRFKVFSSVWSFGTSFLCFFFVCFKHNYHIFTKRHVSLCNRQVATNQYVRIISVILCAESQHQRASQSMSLTQHETLLL